MSRILGTVAYSNLKHLEAAEKVLLAENEAASRRYLAQKDRLDFLKRTEGKVQSLQIMASGIVQDLEKEIAARGEEAESNWYGWVVTSTSDVVPTAFVILMGVILTPLAIKSIFFFVVAPLASRCPPVCILPEVDGTILGIPTGLPTESNRLSRVSATLSIDADHQILIHPEYLQSSARSGSTTTKWLLDWSYPLSSLAAGMFALTRIQSQSPDFVVISATKDPLSEVGAISLPIGSAVVLQPHSMVGVRHRKDAPLKITPHWRLGSLHAWLTLQLRFIVFHGPADLLVKGCRGVRVEPAAGGRRINQAATIGFSANARYSTTRCETFASYFMGKQELLNDNIEGASAFLIYEEMPHYGARTGITGRGLEGLTDSMLKVFGV